MISDYSVVLQTDLYQLTMAQSYFYSQTADTQAIFIMNFRQQSFGNGYIVFSGLAPLLEKISNYRFSNHDLEYLASLNSPKGKRLFSDEFLNYLTKFRLQCDIWSVDEGQLVFAQQPVLKVCGRLIDCQLLESMILNSLHYSSLVSTKAGRTFVAAKGSPVLEFGLRRAPGAEGSLIASRAAYIGGCNASSNLLAGQKYKIPVSGTHSHSWVLSFDDQATAFENFIKYNQDNLVLVVDSYDTLSGVAMAIDVVSKFKNAKRRFLAIRIDSGDLNYLSNKARKMLDKAGFKNTKIIASSDLDEYIIESLQHQGAKINTWAIGTKLVSNNNQNSLSAVYKLSAIKKDNGEWQNKLKLSNDPYKINNPGNLQIRRFYDQDHKMVADAIYDLNIKSSKNKTKWQIISFENPLSQQTIGDDCTGKDILQPVVKKGKVITNSMPLAEIRDFTIQNINLLDSGIKRLVNPHIYPVGLEASYYEKKLSLILETKKKYLLE